MESECIQSVRSMINYNVIQTRTESEDINEKKRLGKTYLPSTYMFAMLS